MSWWDRFVAIFKSEASDVKEGLGKVGKSIDEELARREQELAASPEERIDMILEEQAAEDARFQELENKVLGHEAQAEATEEVTEVTDEAAEATDEEPSADETDA